MTSYHQGQAGIHRIDMEFVGELDDEVLAVTCNENLWRNALPPPIMPPFRELSPLLGIPWSTARTDLPSLAKLQASESLVQPPPTTKMSTSLGTGCARVGCSDSAYVHQ